MKLSYIRTEYKPAPPDQPLCDCKELIPGLDASMCRRCQLIWNVPWKEETPQKTLDIADLPVLNSVSKTQPEQSARKLPRNIPGPISFTYAITLKRPWAWAIAHYRKRVENRDWKCYAKPGEWIAIHAGKGYVFEDADWIEDRFGVTVPDPQDHPTGIVALAQFLGNATKSESPWFNRSKFGWLFGEVRTLAKPVKCSGQRGLWKPDQGVKERVYKMLEERS